MIKRGSRVLVGGGSGFIGRQLCFELDKHGYEVKILSRSRQNTHKYGKTLTWDDVKADSQFFAKNKFEGVVNLAGVNVLDVKKRWTESFKKEVYESRIETARTISSAIRSCADESLRPKVSVQITGINYYPTVDKLPSDLSSVKVYTEDDDCGNESSFMAGLVRDWESAASLPDDFCRLVTVRSGVVLGRGGGMIENLYVPFYFGVGGNMGLSGGQPMPWIHVKDMACLIKYALETPSLKGPINGVSPQIISNSQFVSTFSSALNRPAFFHTPEFVFDTIFGKERSVMIMEGGVVKSKKAEDFVFEYPTIESACGELVNSDIHSDWFSKQPTP